MIGVGNQTKARDTPSEKFYKIEQEPPEGKRWGGHQSLDRMTVHQPFQSTTTWRGSSPCLGGGGEDLKGQKKRPPARSMKAGVENQLKMPGFLSREKFSEGALSSGGRRREKSRQDTPGKNQ